VKILSIKDQAATLELERNELIAINNALNEILNGLDLATEFETRMETSREKARTLLKAISSLL
jgi:hypothetical protein